MMRDLKTDIKINIIILEKRINTKIITILRFFLLTSQIILY